MGLHHAVDIVVAGDPRQTLPLRTGTENVDTCVLRRNHLRKTTILINTWSNKTLSHLFLHPCIINTRKAIYDHLKLNKEQERDAKLDEKRYDRVPKPFCPSSGLICCGFMLLTQAGRMANSPRTYTLQESIVGGVKKCSYRTQ